MDLAELQQTIYDNLNITGTVPSTDIARVLRRLNQVQREVLSRKGIGPKLRRATLTCATVASSPYVVLPQSAVHLYTLMDRTNNTPLAYSSLDNIRYNDPGNVSSSNPYSYDILNFNSQVARDPSAAGQLTVVSDSASDDTTKTAFIEVTRTGGYFQATSVALNGVTPANLGPTDSLYVLKFYLSLSTGGETTATGNIILKDGAGNELARVPPTRRYARYTRLILFPVPSSAITLYADVDLHIESLSQASDEPYLPEDFHDILEHGVMRMEYNKKEKSAQYDRADRRFNMRIAELRSWLNRPTGTVLNANRGRRVSFSALGPNFPPGS